MRLPSVFTEHEALLNVALARWISPSVRGEPRVRADWVRPGARGGGINSGASQNAYQRFLSITSGVSSIPAARRGSACCVDIRLTPVTTRYSGVRFSPRVAQAPLALRTARS